MTSRLVAALARPVVWQDIRGRLARHDLVGADLARCAHCPGQLLDVEDFGRTPVIHRLIAGNAPAAATACAAGTSAASAVTQN
jgi:hypothetical protein